MTFELYNHQKKAIHDLRVSLSTGHRRPVIGTPTGSGKTILAADIIKGALKKRNRVGFSVPLINLIDQTIERFIMQGIELRDIGVIQADHHHVRPHAPVQICSVQTTQHRGWPDVDFGVIDECHLQFDTVKKWMAEDPKKIFVGLSATPWAKGLGDYWDDLLLPTTIKELTDAGFLSPIRAFVPTKPDLSEVKTVAGDFHQGQLSEVMSKNKIVGDVVQNWVDLAERRPTMVFAVDRGHAEALARAFDKVAVPTAYVDANTPRDERSRILRAFNGKQIDVIVSIGTMNAGVDADVRCISFARPTKSSILWVQSVGRGLRPGKGKEHLLLLDHSGTALRLGLPADIMYNELRISTPRGEREADDEERGPREVPKPRECFKCHAVMSYQAKACPECGVVIYHANRVKTLDGELVEMGAKGQRRTNREMTWTEKAVFFGELLGYAEENHYKKGWAANKYRERCGVWPNDYRVRDCYVLPASTKTRSWIRSSQLKWLKTQPRRSDAEIIAGSMT